MGAGVEELVSPLLSQPKCDCLLIMNLDLASREWLDLVTWRMKDSKLSGTYISSNYIHVYMLTITAFSTIIAYSFNQNIYYCLTVTMKIDGKVSHCELIHLHEYSQPSLSSYIRPDKLLLFIAGCLVVFTAQSPSSGHSPLPEDFIRSCRTISLSKISFSSSKGLPKQLWLSKGRHDFYSLLELCLATISPQTMAQCEMLSDSLRPLLFNLSVLHAATVTTRSSSTMTSFEYPHLSLFIRCVEELLALTKHGDGPKMDASVVLKVVSVHVCDVYSCCLPKHKLEELVGTCLSEEAMKPSAHIHLESTSGLAGVDVIVPSQAVTPKMFSDHVKGLVETADEKRSNNHFLR